MRAAVAARGIFGAAMGPWSAGSTALLLLRAASDPSSIGNSAFPRGGMGALTSAMAAAAREAGAEIRTGAEVERILVKNGASLAYCFDGGEEISAKRVVSGADPQRTFLRLLDPGESSTEFCGENSELPLRKAPSQNSTWRSTRCPRSAAARRFPNRTTVLAGRIHIGPGIDYLERAFDASKYGEFSRAPYLDVSIPSILDDSLAPAGKHVMSIHMQFAPYRLKTGRLAATARRARRHDRQNARRVRSGSAGEDSWRARS